MIRKDTPNLHFQTFFVSREMSHCPLVAEIIRSGKIIDECDLLKNSTGVISLRYGKRMVMNASNVKFAEIKREDLVEIVDYDPIKKLLLAIGQTEPHIDTSVHWLIQNARTDVNAIVQVNGREIAERFSKKLPKTTQEFPSGSLELAKEALKMLRGKKAIVLKKKGVLFVGMSLKEVETLVVKTCRGF